MNISSFCELLHKASPLISKEATTMRRAMRLDHLPSSVDPMPSHVISCYHKPEICALIRQTRRFDLSQIEHALFL